MGYRCLVCDKWFKNINELLKHLKENTECRYQIRYAIDLRIRMQDLKLGSKK